VVFPPSAPGVNSTFTKRSTRISFAVEVNYEVAQFLGLDCGVYSRPSHRIDRVKPNKDMTRTEHSTLRHSGNVCNRGLLRVLTAVLWDVEKRLMTLSAAEMSPIFVALPEKLNDLVGSLAIRFCPALGTCAW
jgi:hypothetical protein